ncbi:MAG: hypothetical protein K2Z80_37525 [Xanthobacteraceae bacterium]|nr:hypothetical protein [Xanthobacteraceae bacterium]
MQRERRRRVMSGRRDRRQTVTQTPPPNSRLALYIANLERLGEGATPLWKHPDKDVRAVAVAVAMRNEPRLWALPLELVRDELVVPTLHKLGMPTGPRESWLDALIDSAAIHAQSSNKLQSGAYDDLLTAKRPGHPAAKLWPSAVFHAAYLDAIEGGPRGIKDNRHFEAVAARLGPGVDRDHVRRVVKSFRQRLGALDEAGRTMLLSAALAVSRLLHEFDQANPPKNGHARKLGAERSLLERRA